MKTKRQCVVCILNQMLRVADYLELSEEAKDAVLQKTLKKAAGIPYSRITAPQLAQQLYGVVEKISGISDPYKALRKEQNDLVLNRIEMFEDRIKQSPDPLLTAGYYSLLGNIIDYGGVRVFDAQEVFKHFGEIEITINGYPRFKERLKQAKRVLVLGDNAGEAVFDKLFIREMKLFNPLLEIFYGVRSGPAINDVIKEDALYIGIH
ncbi:MAG: DUF89 family protein, partial [bacterium]|nr:DUF89 family protein [bacterium]